MAEDRTQARSRAVANFTLAGVATRSSSTLVLPRQFFPKRLALTRDGCGKRLPTEPEWEHAASREGRRGCLRQMI